MHELSFLVGGDVYALILVPAEDEVEFTRWLGNSGYQYRQVIGSKVPQFSVEAGNKLVDEYLDYLEDCERALQS
ncbi:MAG: hypothetical protein ACWGQW_08790 [bacterium]